MRTWEGMGVCVRGHVPAQRCGLTRTWAKGYIYNCEHRIHLDVLKVFLVVLSHVPIHQASHPQDCAHEAQAVACKRSSGTVVACYNQDAWCCASNQCAALAPSCLEKMEVL